MAAVPDCGFDGNSDLYGLGIRVGLYLQWFSYTVSRFFRLESSGSLFESYLAFQVALLIAIFIVTFQPVEATQYLVEIAVLLYVAFGGWLVTIEDANTYFELLGTLTQSILSGYAVWYWATLSARDEPQISTGCNINIFLFTKISSADVLSPISKVFAVLAAMMGIGSLATYYYNQFPFLIGAISPPMDKAYKDSIVSCINKECPELMMAFLIGTCRLHEPLRDFIRVEDIGYNRVMIRSELQSTRYICYLPLRLTNKLEADKRALLDWNENVASLRKDFLNESSDSNFYWRAFRGYGFEAGSLFTQTEDTQTIQAFLRRKVQVFRSDNMDILLAELKEQLPEAYHYAFLAKWLDLTMECASILTISYRIFVCIWVIVAVELMIRWNQISGVYSINSVGQLIPFVIGLFTVVGTVYDIHSKFKTRREQEEIPLGDENSRLMKVLRAGMASNSGSNEKSEAHSSVSGTDQKNPQTHHEISEIRPRNPKAPLQRHNSDGILVSKGRH